VSSCGSFGADSTPYRGISWGRLVDFTSTHIPIFAQLAEDVCLGQNPSVGARLIDWAAVTGLPLLAHTLSCCDKVDTESRVFPGCYVNGFSPTLTLHASNLVDCPSADGGLVDLIYQPSGTNAGCWTGSLALVGGTLNFVLCCSTAFGGVVFTLTWSGCDPLTGSASITCPNNCLEPLLLWFTISALNDCCTCQNTIDSATIGVFITGNCQPAVKARLIDFTTSGIPIFATSRYCPWDVPVLSCCTPGCGLVATITDLGGCSCMAGTYTLAYTNGDPPTWTYSGPPGACQFFISLTCAPSTDPRGCAMLTLKIECIYPESDPPVPPDIFTATAYVNTMESIDVTFTLTIDSIRCCNGSISVRIMA
jgi:hypothetical protein